MARSLVVVEEVHRRCYIAVGVGFAVRRTRLASRQRHYMQNWDFGY